MQIEVIIVAVIVFGIMTITGQISINQLISDNQMLFMKLKEKDWDFLVRAKYGNNVNPDILFNKRIKNALITMAIAFAFLITALALFIVRNIKGEKGDYEITLKDAIIIGLFQMVTIIPGISRSGTVLVACLLCHLKRDTALKYTFILYFPVSVATMILGVKDLANTTELSTLLIPYLVGMIAAGLVTYVSYKWLSNWVKQGKLWKFSIYCLLLAIFIFIYFR